MPFSCISAGKLVCNECGKRHLFEIDWTKSLDFSDMVKSQLWAIVVGTPIIGRLWDSNDMVVKCIDCQLKAEHLPTCVRITNPNSMHMCDCK